jgi:hypothetical protein
MEDPIDVPQADAQALAQWMYSSERREEAFVSMDTVRLSVLPNREQMAELLAIAEQSGHQWVLFDGPRQQRPSWVIDPWWTEVPQMTPALIVAARACCVNNQELRSFIIG